MKSDTPRVILFRGIRKHGKGFVYGDLVRKFDTTYIVVYIKESNRYEDIEVIPETVGQFTGLLDKNGKKIFEGDIVHIDNYDEGWDSVVEFNGGAFAVDVEGRDYDYTAIGWTEYQSIIIGNIHDNPELLGVKHGK